MLGISIDRATIETIILPQAEESPSQYQAVIDFIYYGLASKKASQVIPKMEAAYEADPKAPTKSRRTLFLWRNKFDWDDRLKFCKEWVRKYDIKSTDAREAAEKRNSAIYQQVRVAYEKAETVAQLELAVRNKEFSTIARKYLTLKLRQLHLGERLLQRTEEMLDAGVRGIHDRENSVAWSHADIVKFAIAAGRMIEEGGSHPLIDGNQQLTAVQVLAQTGILSDDQLDQVAHYFNDFRHRLADAIRSVDEQTLNVEITNAENGSS